jgi:predicted MFS family arabinose efflux permease
MGIGCFFMPDTPPAKVGVAPIADAMSMLREPNFLVFILISIIVAGLMQFYFLGTAQFMQNMGIASKNVPAAMAIAQAVQAVATFFALGYLTIQIGYKWTLVIGAACWLLMYIIYVNGKPTWLIVVSQALHGLAYVFFIIAGQMLANKLASEATVSSMQALIFAAQSGLGLFLGTQFAGIVMDKFRKQEQFQWNKIFMVPGAVAIACILVFVIFFKVT